MLSRVPRGLHKIHKISELRHELRSTLTSYTASSLKRFQGDILTMLSHPSTSFPTLDLDARTHRVGFWCEAIAINRQQGSKRFMCTLDRSASVSGNPIQTCYIRGCGGVYNTGAQEEQQIIITIMRLNRDVGRRWETIGNCGGKCPRKQTDNVDHERGVSK